MGVNGLWKLLSPSGRMIDIATLRGRMLAVDASIWLTQFLKAMRDEEGRMIANGHIVGTLRRICKLLFHRIRTVFVFDGGVPYLKKRIMEKRRQRQAFDESRRQKAARGLLANQMLLVNEAKKAQFIQSHGEEEEEPKDLVQKEKKASRRRFVQTHDDADEDERSENETKIAPSSRRIKSQPASRSTVTSSASKPSEQLSQTRLPPPDRSTPSSKIIQTVKKSPATELEEIIEENGGETEEDVNEDDSEDELDAIRTIHDFDLSLLKELPRERQYEVLVRLRTATREFRRDELLPAAGDPTQYSSTQLRHFLKDARRKKDIRDIQRTLSRKSTNNAGFRIASDWTKQYTLVMDQSMVGSNTEKTERSVKAIPHTKQDEEAIEMRQEVGVFQSECVERLYEGLNGTVDREECLRLLQANEFNVQSVLKKVQNEKHVQDDQDAKIEQLFSVLNGTINRETCRALLLSNDWRVDETLLKYVESQSEDATEGENQDGQHQDIVDLSESEPKDELQKGKSSIKPAKVVLAGEDRLIFKFRPQDITQESLSLFADVFETGSNVREEFEWEEEEQDSEDGRSSKNILPAPEQKAAESLDDADVEWEDEVERDQSGQQSVDGADPNEAEPAKIITKATSPDQLAKGSERMSPGNDDVYATEDEEMSEGDVEVGRHQPVKDNSMSSTIVTPQEALERAIGISSGFTNWASDAVKRAIRKHAPDIFSRENSLNHKDSPGSHRSVKTETMLSFPPESNKIQSSQINELFDSSESHIPIDSQASPYSESIEKSAFPRVPAAREFFQVPSQEQIEDLTAVPSQPDDVQDLTNDGIPEPSSKPPVPASPFSNMVHQSAQSPKKSSPKKASSIQMPGEAEQDAFMARLQQQNSDLRSEMKRASRDADVVTPEMREDVMELLRLFGMPFIESPMEAEAQCSVLETAGIVDGVITDDSDAFLFGARRVYKNIFTDKKHVEAYDVEDIEKQFGLTREQFIHLALLMGSDYTEGITGIGIVNAVEVLSAFPGENGLEDFKKWVHASQTMEDRTKKRLDPGYVEGESLRTRQFKKSHATIRRKWLVHDAFPEKRVINAYLKPNVHDYSTKEQQEKLVWGEPDVDGIYLFCKQRLNWPDDRFEKEVLEPIRMYTNKKGIQSSMDQFVVRFEDKTRFAAIRSKRMAMAVHGIRSNKDTDLEDDSIVAVDELGNIISIADRAMGKPVSQADAVDEDEVLKEPTPSPSPPSRPLNAKRAKKVIESSSSSSESEDHDDDPLL